MNYNNNQLFVEDPLENEGVISEGDKIISINGIDVEEIIREMHNHVSSDANNYNYKREYVNNAFMEYAPFVFKFQNSYEIEYLKNDQLNLTTLNQLKDYEIDENGKGECGSNLCFNINNGIAIMTIRSFNYYGQNLHTCKQFLDNCFDEINSKGINNLILDFRDNAGGDPYCASYLLQYIAEKSFQYYKTGTSGYLDLQELIEPHLSLIHI